MSLEIVFAAIIVPLIFGSYGFTLICYNRLFAISEKLRTNHIAHTESDLAELIRRVTQLERQLCGKDKVTA